MLRRDASESDGASLSERGPPEDEDSDSPPANRPPSAGVNGIGPYRPNPAPAMPPTHQSPDQIKGQILKRLQDLEELDSVRSRTRAELMKKRRERDEEIQLKRAREDEKRQRKRDLEDAIFAKSEQELDYEESVSDAARIECKDLMYIQGLRQQLKRIKRGLPVDAPFPASRSVSFAAAPPSVSPAENRSPFSSQTEPIRFDPFAKEPPYSTPPQMPYNEVRPIPIDVQASHHPRPVPFMGPYAPPHLPQPSPQAAAFAPINRNSSGFAPVNPPPPPAPVEIVNRHVSTPLNPSHYEASNGPKFKAREHYSPMNPPPFPHRPPVGPPPAVVGPAISPGVTMTKRGPSTHPYMTSEAFAKRHVKCDRVDSEGNGIWHHGASNTDRYIQCNHDNCGRRDWKTLHGFACHIVRRHDMPKGTLQGIQDCLDRYGVDVNSIGAQQTTPLPSQNYTNALMTPITPPVPGRVIEKGRSPEDDDEDVDSMDDEPAYRMQGATPADYHEELIYSDDSNSEEAPKETVSNQSDKTEAAKSEITKEDSPKPQPIPSDASLYDATPKTTSPVAVPLSGSTESLVSSIPGNVQQSVPPPPLVTSDISEDTNKPPEPSSQAPSVPRSVPDPMGTPAASLDMKLALEVKRVNDKRSQLDSDYAESQTMTPQSPEPTPATLPQVPRKSGSRPSTAHSHQSSKLQEVQNTKSPKPVASTSVSTTTPPRSPQQNRSIPPAPESPYKQRVTMQGFAKDAVKRMDRRDLDDSDYADSQETNDTQTNPSTTQDPRSTEATISTKPINQPIPKAAVVSTKKRPATRDGPNSPTSLNRANAFPSKARRTSSRHNSISTSKTTSATIPSTPPVASSTLAQSALQGNSDTDDADSIIVTAVRPASTMSAKSSTVAAEEHPTTSTAGGHGGGIVGKTRRSAAANASKGWSTLVSRREAAAAEKEKEREREREREHERDRHKDIKKEDTSATTPVMKLEDIASPRDREKIKRVLRVLSGPAGTVIEVKRAVEALERAGGREDEAIGRLLDDGAGSGGRDGDRDNGRDGGGGRERGARRSGRK
ncbi:MAG: hypothetical protein Q9160_005730 [Pyrenula sp. 1 TL-2023]